MRNSFEATGYFLGAGQIKTVGQNNTQIRSFWLDMTDRPEYPNTPEFQLRGDKVHLVENIAKNTEVRVKFNLSGRKYDSTATGGKKGVIVNLDAWQITIITAQSAAAARPTPAPQQAPMQRQAQPALAPQSGNGFNSAFNEEDNDLPF